MSIIVTQKHTKELVDLIGKHIQSPEQRLLLGATALATQPFIDYRNKDVDDNTRMISVARTLAKIVAGTIVGVLVRRGGIGLVEALGKKKFTYDAKGFVEKITPESKKDIFTPKFLKVKNCTEEEFERRYSAYIKAMGTMFATVAMIFTNFAIDAPLTRVLTRKFHKIITEKNMPEQKKEVKK